MSKGFVNNLTATNIKLRAHQLIASEKFKADELAYSVYFLLLELGALWGSFSLKVHSKLPGALNAARILHFLPSGARRPLR
eukprot:4003231-Amphidinium_carterae.1